jgi:hypothetical protein
MKKFFTLMMVLTACTWMAKAQFQFSFGPGAGANFAVHSFSDGSESLSRLNTLVTSQFDLQFSRSLALLVWVDFYSDMSAPDISMNYFSIAPTLKYCVLRSPFYLFGGPGFGFNSETRIDIRLGAGYEFFLSNRFTLTPFATFNAGMGEVDSYSGRTIQAIQFGLVIRFNTFK